MDVVAKYGNIPVTIILDKMEELLTLVFQHQAKENLNPSTQGVDKNEGVKDNRLDWLNGPNMNH